MPMLLHPPTPNSPMFRQQREPNPHFLPRHDNNDPIIEFPTPLPRARPPPPHHHIPTSVELPSQPPPRSRPPPPHHDVRTSVKPPYGPTSQPPTQQQLRPLPTHPAEAPPQPHRETRSHPTQDRDSQRGHHSAPLGGGDGHHHHHRRPSLLRGPTSQRTRPFAWLVAVFCMLFWIIIIVGGLIILIVYLVFQPRSPRFDISSVTLNAAYLDMGYLLNADITVLANFTNSNTKVNVDFRYAVLDLYFGKNFIATRYIAPFSVMKRESRFADVHVLVSQVRLSMGLSLELQRQMDNGMVNFEIRGMFRARSKLGGVFRYSYWLYAHCEIEVTGPPTGVLIRKKCVTRR